MGAGQANWYSIYHSYFSYHSGADKNILIKRHSVLRNTIML